VRIQGLLDLGHEGRDASLRRLFSKTFQVLAESLVHVAAFPTQEAVETSWVISAGGIQGDAPHGPEEALLKVGLESEQGAVLGAAEIDVRSREAGRHTLAEPMLGRPRIFVYNAEECSRPR
jgi:hypothetical protein